MDALDNRFLTVNQKGFDMQIRRDADGEIVSRIFTYETNPARERVELYFGDSHPNGRDRLETLREIAGRTAPEVMPKVMMNAGSFTLDRPDDKSFGWTYSNAHGKYEGSVAGGRPDIHVPIPRHDDGYTYYHTLFYYNDGSSEVIRTMALIRAQVIEKSANAVFIISGALGSVFKIYDK